MTRDIVLAAVFTALSTAVLVAPAGAQGIDPLAVPVEFALEVETRVTQAVLDGFERVDSIAALEVDLESGQRFPFRIETFDGGFRYLVLVFTTGCASCTPGLELLDPTGQYARSTTMELERLRGINVGRLNVDQRGSTRARLSAFAEGGPHRMLAMLLRKPL